VTCRPGNYLGDTHLFENANRVAAVGHPGGEGGGGGRAVVGARLLHELGHGNQGWRHFAQDVLISRSPDIHVSLTHTHSHSHTRDSHAHQLRPKAVAREHKWERERDGE